MVSVSVTMVYSPRLGLLALRVAKPVVPAEARKGEV